MKIKLKNEEYDRKVTIYGVVKYEFNLTYGLPPKFNHFDLNLREVKTILLEVIIQRFKADV
jgi:hypothetical protein